MISNEYEKQVILIVDDSMINREFLIDILDDQYQIIEAENGAKAVEILEELGEKISLVLLDIVMPVMDGFGVLDEMNRKSWIDSIPVIMISSENALDFLDRAYDLGVTDFIRRPFDPNIVLHRVANTITLYAKQRRLSEMVAEEIDKRDKNNRMMISILSHIVEFRNGESGLHTLHIRSITEKMLACMMKKSVVSLTEEEVSCIGVASTLHDIGKISIPESILNKPGRLTEEEFAIMKQHAPVGAEMLRGLMDQYDDMLLKKAYEIARWHHERYSGRGYPDGLVGDEIPISAQVVSIADVYDALTSERCYKKAFSHETAMEMILGGQCGVFNPVLLDCLQEIADDLRTSLK